MAGTLGDKRYVASSASEGQAHAKAPATTHGSLGGKRYVAREASTGQKDYKPAKAPVTTRGSLGGKRYVASSASEGRVHEKAPDRTNKDGQTRRGSLGGKRYVAGQASTGRKDYKPAKPAEGKSAVAAEKPRETYTPRDQLKKAAEKKSEPAKSNGSFRDAFASARKAGKSEFEFNGKKYNTKVKGEGSGSGRKYQELPAAQLQAEARQRRGETQGSKISKQYEASQPEGSGPAKLFPLRKGRRTPESVAKATAEANKLRVAPKPTNNRNTGAWRARTTAGRERDRRK